MTASVLDTRGLGPARPAAFALARAAGLILALLPAGCGGGAGGAAPPAVRRLAMNLPTDAPIDTTSGLPALALSPRGDLVVYAANERGLRRLYARRMDRMEAAPLAGTEGAAGPFFSPDGAWVGFFADGRLKKISLGGQGGADLGEAPRPGGASWGADGRIVAVLSIDQGLVRLEGTGDGAQPVRTAGRPGALLLFPDILPGGRLVLVTVADGSGGPPSVAAVNLDTGEMRPLVERGAGGRYVAGGHLLFVREGTLLAAPFDTSHARLSGAAVPVQSGILVDARSGAPHLALSAEGTLIFAPRETSATERRLVRVDRTGAVLPLAADRAAFEHPRLLADGRRLVVSIAEAARLNLWIYDLADGSRRPVPSEVNLTLPLPSPDGRTLAYVAPRAGAWNLFRRPIDETGEPVLLHSSANPLSPSSWTPDGRRLAFTEVRPGTQGDIFVVDAAGAETAPPEPLLATPADEWGLVFSPGGRRVAYTSRESGRPEVFVRPHPGPGEPRRVSDGEGYGPLWSRRGDELFFRRGAEVLAVSMRARPPSPGAPRVLFRGAFEGESAALANYDLLPDGRGFVMVEGVTQTAGAVRIDVVTGWLEEMRRLVAIGQE